MMSTTLYHIASSQRTWRQATDVIRAEAKGLKLHTGIEFKVRDILVKHGLPRDCWDDFILIREWIHQDVPVPIASLLEFVRVQQNRQDGSWSVDGKSPNAGATHRSLQLMNLYGIRAEDQIREGTEYLKKSLVDGGLGTMPDRRTPGPPYPPCPYPGDERRELSPQAEPAAKPSVIPSH